MAPSSSWSRIATTRVEGPEPAYHFQGDELYVRAKVLSTRLKANPYREGEYESAWVQPVVRPRGER